MALNHKDITDEMIISGKLPGTFVNAIFVRVTNQNLQAVLPKNYLIEKVKENSKFFVIFQDGHKKLRFNEGSHPNKNTKLWTLSTFYVLQNI